jgi:helix-turn-helix protein
MVDATDPPDDGDEWFTVRQAAAFARVSTRTVHKWKADQKLTFEIHQDGQYRCRRSELEDLLMPTEVSDPTALLTQGAGLVKQSFHHNEQLFKLSTESMTKSAQLFEQSAKPMLETMTSMQREIEHLRDHARKSEAERLKLMELREKLLDRSEEREFEREKRHRKETQAFLKHNTGAAAFEQFTAAGSILLPMFFPDKPGVGEAATKLAALAKLISQKYFHPITGHGSIEDAYKAASQTNHSATSVPAPAGAPGAGGAPAPSAAAGATEAPSSPVVTLAPGMTISVEQLDQVLASGMVSDPEAIKKLKELRDAAIKEASRGNV